MPKHPFNDGVLLNWFAKELIPTKAAAPSLLPPEVGLIGHGPFSTVTLCGFVHSCNVRCLEAAADVETIVLGRNGWRPEELWELIRSHSHRPLNIYSQELFIVFLLTGRDPKQADGTEVLHRFVADHPGIAQLTEYRFNWLDQKVCAPEWVPSMLWPQVQLLRHLGYNHTADRTVRRNVLRRAYSQPIPNVLNAQYMHGWGEAGTAIRLLRIAEEIAGLSRHMRRHANPDVEAIETWEDDLRWLHDTFSPDRLTNWPTTAIP